jgi:hypothetical protein
MNHLHGICPTTLALLAVVTGANVAGRAFAAEQPPRITPDHPAFSYDWNQSPGKAIRVRENDITYLHYEGAATEGDVKKSDWKHTGMVVRDGKAWWLIDSQQGNVRTLRACEAHVPRNQRRTAQSAA